MEISKAALPTRVRSARQPSHQTTAQRKRPRRVSIFSSYSERVLGRQRSLTSLPPSENESKSKDEKESKATTDDGSTTSPPDFASSGSHPYSDADIYGTKEVNAGSAPVVDQSAQESEDDVLRKEGWTKHTGKNGNDGDDHK